MFLGSLYCKQYGPDQTAPKGVHIVCFHDKIYSEVQLNICNRHKKQTTFSRQTNIGWIRVKLTRNVIIVNFL